MSKCASKVRHKTRDQAEQARWNMRMNGRDVSTLNAYRCSTCGGWHLGNLTYVQDSLLRANIERQKRNPWL